jgi:hypothetical protein
MLDWDEPGQGFDAKVPLIFSSGWAERSIRLPWIIFPFGSAP